MSKKYNNHNYVSNLVKKAQDADSDERQEVRDATLFIHKKDGQWEPYWWNKNQGKPRYTFDMCGPVVDQIAGELESANFSITVDPAGGGASKENAKVISGMVRNIERMSNATHIYNSAARSMITGGIAGWRVVQKYSSGDSFDQDLIIEPIENFVDRVWLDISSQSQDGSGASWGVVLQDLTREDYEERWPEGSGGSVSDGRQASAYDQKPDAITVGEFLYKKPIDRELVLMDNGQVYEVNDDYEKVKDELAAVGVTEKARRKRKTYRVYSRFYDNSGWLDEEKETVFSYIPVIPTYGNFAVIENKHTYSGAIRRLMDYQRVYNYTESRAITEAALAPRAKIPMTDAMMAGHVEELSTLNIDDSPVLSFNPDPELPGYIPQQIGGAQVNQGLSVISASMKDGIARAAGLFASNMGEAVNNQSGVAIKALQDKGDIGTAKFFSAQEVAISHTAKVIIDAIPRVYDTERQVRILGEDGQASMQTLNQRVLDEETGEVVTLNDLSEGSYDVVCSAGASFQNKQQETVASILEMAAIDPSVVAANGDILFSNVDAPGMDLIAERKRRELFNAGMIPDEQLTEEETQELEMLEQQQAQQGEQPDAMVLAAQAEMQKAQAEQAKVEQSREKNMMDFQAKQSDLQLKAQKQQIEAQKIEMDLQAKLIELQRKEQELELKAYQQRMSDEMKAVETMSNIDNKDADTNKKEAETAKILAETQDIVDDSAIEGLSTDEIITRAKLLRQLMEGVKAQGVVDDSAIKDMSTGEIIGRLNE